jgi:hypothetical protein
LAEGLLCLYKFKLMKAIITALAVPAFLFSSFDTAVSNEKQSGRKIVTQQNAAPTFSFFRTHRQGKAGITATWGLTASTNVSGFIVQKTYEDPTDPYANWETVSLTPCTGERSYKCTDANVFPGFISYRVIASMINGGEIISEVSTVHIVSH